MAKNNIILDIGSKFNGEGFKKLKGAMKDAGSTAKTAGKAIKDISTAMGEVGGEAGKVAGAIGGITQAFASMGIAGGVIAAGTLAIQELFKWLNKTNDALSALANGFKEKMKAGVEATKNQIEKLNKLFNDVIGKNKVGNERRDIRAGGELGMMELQKRQALAGKEGVEAAKIELEWTKKIEDYKEKQSKQHLEDVKKEIALTQANLKKQEQEQAKAYEKFKDANKYALDSWNDDNLDAVTKNRRSDDARVAKAQWQAYAKPIEELKKKLETLSTQELKASTDASLAPEQRKTAIKEAETKLAKEVEREAKEKKEKNDKAAKEAADKKAKEDKEKERLRKEKEKAEKREKAEDAATAAREKNTKIQEQLSKEMEKSKKAVNDWIAGLKQNAGVGARKGYGTSFGDFQKQRNEDKKNNQMLMGPDGKPILGPDGQPIKIGKGQQKEVERNRRELERLKKIRNPSKQVKDWIDQRQAFDDMFNPQKYLEELKKQKEIEAQKRKAEEEMKTDIKAIKKWVVDENGAAL